MENSPGEAYFHEDGTRLYLDVWEEDATWLAVAFCGLILIHLDLVFCDEGHTFDVRVPVGTTEAEPAALVNAAG
ncbi:MULTISPECIES: hypothetical protein [unclassified Streptomyces]|uniref:hypothetical protein n=1 Tax=unclassified Streptomyces TaxID=2593676 RepID=UPI0035E39232